MKYYLGYFAVVMFLVGLGIGAIAGFIMLAAKVGFFTSVLIMVMICWMLAND